MTRDDTDGSWYDRAGSHREFLSASAGAAYLPHYVYDLFAGDGALPRYGAAALLAVLAQAATVMTELFFVVCVFWFADMLLGMARALRDPDKQFRWTKAGDGILRLMVIMTLPPIISIASLVPESAWGIEIGDGAVVFVLGLMAAAEFWSILENAIFFWPSLETVRLRFIRTNREK